MDIITTASVNSAYYLNTLDKGHTQPNKISQEPTQAKTSSVKITISAEAIEKLEQEKKAIGSKIAQQFTEKANNSTEQTEESSADSLDALIDQLKEQITEIQDKLKKLNNDKSEEATKQKEALSAQLMSLQGALMSLIGKKLDEAEADT